MTSRALSVLWIGPVHSTKVPSIETQKDACTVVRSRPANATKCVHVFAPDIVEDSLPTRDSINPRSHPGGSRIAAFLTHFFLCQFPRIRRKRYSASTAPVQQIKRLDQSPHRGRAR
jgi:hypothetical protein